MDRMCGLRRINGCWEVPLAPSPHICPLLQLRQRSKLWLIRSWVCGNQTLCNNYSCRKKLLPFLGIPLSRHCPPDKIAWAYTPSGAFSTSSAYKLLASGADGSQGESSNRSAQKQFWKGVWGLRVPNKFKHFIWWACNNALTTMSHLYQRQITPSDKCELCNLYPEDPLHAICLCSEVETTWSSSQCFDCANFPHPQSSSDLLSHFLQVKEDYRKEVFSITAWLLWNRRFGEMPFTLADLCAPRSNLCHWQATCCKNFWRSSR